MIQSVLNTCHTDVKAAFNILKNTHYTHAINVQEFVNNLHL